MIIEHNCDNCRNAFRAGPDDYVLCGYWQNQYESQETYKKVKDFIKYVVFAETNLENAAVGFGYRKQHNKLESHWSSKGTVSESIITNFQILIPKAESCYQFVIYKEEGAYA